jgi:hypothetical protein
LPSFWWVDGVNPAPTAYAPPEPAPPPAPSAPPVEVAAAQPPVALSFEEWLRSMGASASETAPQETPPTVAAEETEPSLVEEPAAAVLDVRPRVRSVRREKVRERLAVREGPGGIALAMVGTFAAGLLVGALSVRQVRLRRHAEPLDVPPASR